MKRPEIPPGPEAVPDWRSVTEAMVKNPHHPAWETYFNPEAPLVAMVGSFMAEARENEEALEEADEYTADLEAENAALRSKVEALQRELAFYKRKHPLETS